MIKFRKKLLAVLLTAAMLISMSSVVAWSDEQPADEQTTQTEQTTEEDNASDGEEDSKDDKKDEEDVPRTDEEGLAEMKVIAENSNYKLYLNEKTTNFAVQSKSDNYV